MDDLLLHENLHDGGKLFECTSCGRRCKDLAHLRKHEAVHMKTIEVQYRCQKCDEEFDDADSLTAHLGEHVASNVSEIVCAECGHISTSFSDHQLHLSEHSTTVKQYHCIICDRRLASAKALFGHMRRLHASNNIKQEDGMVLNIFNYFWAANAIAYRRRILIGLSRCVL